MIYLTIFNTLAIIYILFYILFHKYFNNKIVFQLERTFWNKRSYAISVFYVNMHGEEKLIFYYEFRNRKELEKQDYEDYKSNKVKQTKQWK